MSGAEYRCSQSGATQADVDATQHEIIKDAIEKTLSLAVEKMLSLAIGKTLSLAVEKMLSLAMGKTISFAIRKLLEFVLDKYVFSKCLTKSSL